MSRKSKVSGQLGVDGLGSARPCSSKQRVQIHSKRYEKPFKGLQGPSALFLKAFSGCFVKIEGLRTGPLRSTGVFTG